jgi:hypothetical protein
MTLATVHEHFEQRCPDGAGFALHVDLVAARLADAVASIGADAKLHIDLPLLVTNAVNFSFEIDPATVSLSQDWLLSLALNVWLHLPGDPTAEIVRVAYRIEGVRVGAEYDASRNNCAWTPAAPATPNMVGETWEATGAHLVAAGFVDAAGNPDRDRFLREIYYGFVWINAAQLVATIFRAIPFPQLQKYTGPLRLKPPFQFEVVDSHFAVWTDEVDIIDVHCGGGNIPKPPASANWHAIPHAGPKSPREGSEPVLGLYVAAQTLVSWQAGYLAPAVSFSSSGGGFIRYDLDATVSLRSLDLSVQPDPNGGSLSIDAGLRLTAQADSYMNGPCGTRLSLASATITGNGSAHADVRIRYDRPSRALRLELDVRADIDQTSVHVTSGGLLGGILGEIVEILYKSGIIKVDTSYRRRSGVDLLDLSDESMPFRTAQRVGDRSAFFVLDRDE